MAKKKLSIIVPCYKVEKYLPRCLDSLVNQTLEDIEVICFEVIEYEVSLIEVKKLLKLRRQRLVNRFHKSSMLVINSIQ